MLEVLEFVDAVGEVLGLEGKQLGSGQRMGLDIFGTVAGIGDELAVVGTLRKLVVSPCLEQSLLEDGEHLVVGLCIGQHFVQKLDGSFEILVQTFHNGIEAAVAAAQVEGAAESIECLLQLLGRHVGGADVVRIFADQREHLVGICAHFKDVVEFEELICLVQLAEQGQAVGSL